MQTITWSPNLIFAVKKLKKADMYTAASNFSERKVMDSFQLSTTEEQAIKSTLSPNKAPEVVNNYW